MTLIKIAGKNSPHLGRTRSEQAKNLMSDGWGNTGLSLEQLDKCKYLEKKTGKRYLTQPEIDRVK